jgi:hypothetical protein
LACSTASHGAGKSRKTTSKISILQVSFLARLSHTGVNAIRDRKSVFTGVAVGESHDIGHAMKGELLSNYKMIEYKANERRKYLPGLGRSCLMEFIRPKVT